MKHTMKKLLCMALAIMLLVSAVPVFAAADGFDVELQIKGYGYNGTITEAEGSAYTVQNYLDYYAPNWSDSYEVATNTDGSLKLWVKNEDMPDGKYVSADYPITKASKVVVALNAIGGGSSSGGGSSTPTPDPTYSVQINVKLDNVEQGWYTATIKDSSTTVQNLIDYKVDANLVKGYHFRTAYTNTYLDESGIVNSGDKVYIAFEKDVPTVDPISIVVKVDGSDNVVWTGSKVPANGVSAKVADLLSYCWNSDWDDVYTFDHAWSHEQQKNVAKTGSIDAGDTVYIMLKKGATIPSTPSTPITAGKLELTIRVNGTKKYDNDVKNFTSATVASVIKNVYDSDWTSKYAFDKVVVNGVTYGRSDLEVRAGDEVDIYLTRKYSKDNSNKVYLHVYLNGDASTIAMTKDITGTYLMDDWKTDTTEILNYLKNNYYTAKDSSNAITIDGLYVSTDGNGTFPSRYYADDNVPSKDNINDLLEDGYVHISVMLKNAKAKSSSTADSSNPKTGDTIFVPVMVMGVTGTVLAAAYVFGKKRFAR